MGLPSTKAVLIVQLLLLFCPLLLSQNAFITTWKTDNPGTSNSRQITIPGSGIYTLYWEEVGNPSNSSFELGMEDVETLTLPNPGTYRIEITGDFTQIQFAGGGDRLKLLTIEQWGNIAWSSMEQAFEGCENLSYNATDTPNLASITSFFETFKNCRLFNGAIGNWNMSQVVNLDSMFYNARAFNQDLAAWNVSNVESMDFTFYNANVFNQDISAWDVSQVESMSGTFYRAFDFNQDLSNWDVSNVQLMIGTFLRASDFNQDLSAWDVSGVSNMNFMFWDATSFDQDLSSWDMGNVENMVRMFDGSALSRANYDKILIGWASQSLQTNVTLGATGLEYCAGVAARNTLTSTYNWNISGDTAVNTCSFNTIWKTDNPGPSGNRQINVPGIGNYDIYWQEVGNTANNGTAAATNSHTITFPNPGTYEVRLSGNLQQILFNGGGDRNKILSIESWGDFSWTSMYRAFHGCENLVLNATDAPNLSAVTSCVRTFEGCLALNSNINHWDVSTITDMRSMFQEAAAFNQSLSNWDVSLVTNMEGMFREASSFNQDLSDWDVSSLENMQYLFASTSFNQDLSDWEVGSVSNMASCFEGNTAFNQDISSWDIGLVENLSAMFKNATSFNHDISNWDTGSATNLESMFRNAQAFDHNIGDWDVSQVTTMANMLDSCGMQKMQYDSTLIGWGGQSLQSNVNLGAVDLRYCLSDSIRNAMMTNFNWDITGDLRKCGFVTTWKTDNEGISDDNQITIPAIGSYDVYWEEVGNESQNNGTTTRNNNFTITFDTPGTYRVYLSAASGYLRFDNSGDRLKILTIDEWGDQVWSNMDYSFFGCYHLTSNASDAPNLSNITSLAETFKGCNQFNGDVSNWDVSNVTNMVETFRGAVSFNQDISAWNVGNVQNFTGMFHNADSFNQDISGWDVSSATKTKSMFLSAEAFNQDISSWDMSAVTNLESMFRGTLRFNQNLTDWDVSSATNMRSMFLNATAFDQNLGDWDISSINTMSGMLANSGLSTANYDSTLISWVQQVPPSDVNFGAAGLTYCEGQNARNILEDDYNWTISGDLANPACAFSTIWKTDNPGSSNNDQVTIPASGTFDVHWQEVGDSSNSGSANSVVGPYTITFPQSGTYQLIISGDLSQITFNDSGDKNKILSIENWGNIEWTTFQNAFYGCSNLIINAADAPDLSGVTSMNNMFKNTTSLTTGGFANWEVSTVTDMGGLFSGATNFIGDVSGWEVSNVNVFAGVFRGCVNFNQDLSDWDVSNGQLFFNMFRDASSFDQNIGTWNISAAVNMQNMLDGCGMSVDNYDATLIDWFAQTSTPANQILGANSLSYCLGGTARSLLVDTHGWTITGDSVASSCTSPFVTIWQTDNPGSSNDDQITIPGTGNYSIVWEEVGNPSNTGLATAMGHHTITFPSLGTYLVKISANLFRIRFNGVGDAEKLLSIESWGEVNWYNMGQAFYGCHNLTYNATEALDLSNVFDCSDMFHACANFNGAIGNWNISGVGLMENMFRDAVSFNQDIGNWATWNVRNMRHLFSGTFFNQDIGNWNTSRVTNMGSMFEKNPAFNQDISAWDVSKVQFMGFMFKDATAFNQDLSNWNTGMVTKMESTFAGALAFDQNIGGWNISQVTNMNAMLNNSALSVANYDATLIGWASQSVSSNINLGAIGLKYCTGTAARDSLINNYDWTITGDAPDCPFISLSAKIFLEGAFLNSSDTLMNDDLRLNSALPSISPYADHLSCDLSVFNTSGANAIVDWVWVELRSATDTAIVAGHSGLLQRNGRIVDVDGLSPITFPHSPADFFIAVSHRNHLSILSATAHTFGPSTLAFDFTASPNSTLGGLLSVANVPGGFALFSGDIDDNGQVQNTDVTALIPELGNAGYLNADIDMNGQVQNAELNNLLLLNLGKGEQF